MGKKKNRNRRPHDFGTIESRTWNAAANKLAAHWAEAIRMSPQDFEEADAFLWYAQTEEGGFTLSSVRSPSWDSFGRDFMVSIGLIARRYNVIEDYSESRFETAYEGLVKQSISCLRAARKTLLSKSWPRELRWVKTKTCCFVDNAESINDDVLIWLGGKRLSRKPPTNSVESIIRFSRKHDLIPEWAFVGKKKKLKAIVIYEAVTRPSTLRELIKLLEELPRSFLAKKLIVTENTKVRQPYLSRLEKVLNCKATFLTECFFDYIEKFETDEWEDLAVNL